MIAALGVFCLSIFLIAVLFGEAREYWMVFWGLLLCLTFASLSAYTLKREYDRREAAVAAPPRRRLGRVHTTTNQIRHPGESGARGQDSSGPELSGSGSPGDKREQALVTSPSSTELVRAVPPQGTALLVGSSSGISGGCLDRSSGARRRLGPRALLVLARGRRRGVVEGHVRAEPPPHVTRPLAPAPAAPPHGGSSEEPVAASRGVVMGIAPSSLDGEVCGVRAEASLSPPPHRRLRGSGVPAPRGSARRSFP